MIRMSIAHLISSQTLLTWKASEPWLAILRFVVCHGFSALLTGSLNVLYKYMYMSSSPSSRAMGSAPVHVGVRCQFHELPPTSSVRRHLARFLKPLLSHSIIT